MNVFIWQYRNTELSVRVCLCVCVWDWWACWQTCGTVCSTNTEPSDREVMKLSPSVCSSLNMLLSTNIGTEPYSLQSLTARLSTPLLYQCSRVLLLKPQVRAQRAFGFEIPRDSNSRICFIGRRYKYSEFPLMSKNKIFFPLFFLVSGNFLGF